METKKWQVGPHLYTFEPPDIYHCNILGPVQPHEALETVRILEEEIIPSVPEVFVLAQFSSMGAFPANTRKAIANIEPTWAGIAIVGGTAIARTAMNITLRAMSLLSGKQPPMRMFKTLEEGYAFLNEIRANRRKAANS